MIRSARLREHTCIVGRVVRQRDAALRDAPRIGFGQLYWLHGFQNRGSVLSGRGAGLFEFGALLRAERTAVAWTLVCLPKRRRGTSPAGSLKL